MRYLLCALALIICAAGPAAAQAPAAQSPMSAEELIAAGQADGVFQPLAAEGAVAVRHARSGLVCRMNSAYRNRLVIFPQAARGEDVACDSTDGRETVTLYATRFSIEAPLDVQYEGAVAAIRNRFPDALPIELGAELPSFAGPEQRSGGFITQSSDGVRLYTRVSIAVVNGWSIKLRYSLEAPDQASARAAEQAAAALWVETLRALTAQQL